MAYYIRVLSPSEKSTDLRLLSEAIVSHGCKVTCDANTDYWQQLETHGSHGETLFILERNAVAEGPIALEELAEFDSEISECLPKSASNWLRDYLASVRTIYAFQVFGAIERDNGWAALNEAKTKIWNSVGGIFQADGEGFSNEDGYHILWQFSENVSGDWWMAVLENGEWQRFKIDLGNPLHRDAFKRGAVPTGATRAP
jgi:hypothetical protein